VIPKEAPVEERPGIAERLIEAIRDGIDAARYFARHEVVGGMSDDDQTLVDLANAVEEAAADLDEAMMAMLEHQDRDGEREDDSTN
jgi:hypothetical protein